MDAAGLGLVDRTRTETTRQTFQQRVADQADRLREALTDGAFDGGYAIGLELEGYAVDADGRLASVPDAITGTTCESELGRHNAELNTPATGFDADGIDTQIESVAADLATLRSTLGEYGRRFVTDGMWTIEPAEGAERYLTAVETVDAAGDGERTVPANMAPAPRYHALDADITADGPLELSVPGCHRTFPSILVESLATSMQVHLQTPVDRFVEAFNVALRTVGPVLALATNAPFLPPALYDDPTPATVFGGPAELRVPVFEAMNVRTPGKVRFPEDLDAVETVLDRLVADRQCAPYLREFTTDETRTTGFEDRYWELLHKQSTCWRWVRPILGPTGPRIEYRPLPAQPSSRGVASLQALVAGLVHGALVTEHPVRDLSWERARASFEAAAADGLPTGETSNLAWITRGGERTDRPDRLYEDLFALAATGLRDRGLSADRVDRLLAPLETRYDRGLTPGGWKRDRARTAVAEGTALPAAIETAQRAYIERAVADEPFADWPAPSEAESALGR